jgi:hypothetical protein
MGYNFQGVYDVHDWKNPFRYLIDCIEVPALVLLTLYGFLWALRADEAQPAPLWEIVMSLHNFWRFLSGSYACVAGVLLLRDWGRAFSERKEEKRRRKEALKRPF